MIYRSITNPTSATYFVRGFKPITGARYIKIRLIGGYTDTDQAGTTYFDNIALIPLPNATQTGTIAENHTALETYAELGNVDVPVPTISSGVLQLDMFAEGKLLAGAVTGTYKMSVGNYNSNEVVITSTSYQMMYFRLIVPHSEISNGIINVKLYAKSGANPWDVYGKKVSPYENISINVIPF